MIEVGKDFVSGDSRRKMLKGIKGKTKNKAIEAVKGRKINKKEEHNEE